MEIRYIETTVDADYTPDTSGTKLIIQVENELEINLNGFGSGEARLTVRALHFNERLQGVIDAIPPEVWTAIAKAVVWAEPRTIAYLVYETVNGQ